MVKSAVHTIPKAATPGGVKPPSAKGAAGDTEAGTSGNQGDKTKATKFSFKAWAKEEFKLANFLLDHDQPRLFVTPETNQHLPIFLVYRFVALMAGISALVISGIDSASLRWFCYLTNWTFSVMTLDAAMKLFAGIYHYYLVDKRRTLVWKLRMEKGKGVHIPESTAPLYEKMPVGYKMLWVFHNVAYTATPVAVILYWGAYYQSSTMSIGFISICMNIINPIYITLDALVVAIPMRLLHVFHAAIFFLLWSIFIVVYWAVGGTSAEGATYLYHGLNFPTPHVGTYLWLPLLLVFGVPLFHVLWYLLTRLRVFLYDKCGIEREQSFEPHERYMDDSDDESDWGEDEGVSVIGVDEEAGVGRKGGASAAAGGKRSGLGLRKGTASSRVQPKK